MAPQSTMLELVFLVTEFAHSEAEVTAIVAFLVNKGFVQLCGNFKGARIDLLPEVVRTAPATHRGVSAS